MQKYFLQNQDSLARMNGQYINILSLAIKNPEEKTAKNNPLNILLVAVIWSI